MGTPLAKRDPSFEPVRVHGDFQREHPDAEASATEVTLNLTLAGTLTINRVDELLAQYGLVLKGFNVLAVVAGATEALTPTAIADRTVVGKTTVTAVLDALERRQLVLRRPHPVSRRSVLVEVTPEGRQACDEILARLHVLEAQWLADMPEADRQTLLRLLGEARGLFSRAQVPPRPASAVHEQDEKGTGHGG
ncbi:MAG TPA: MarR family transcriptional regulator [Streptosporangiaceae bacterium]|nr:MarR family transcriptional regulator [Streptosporangiaceae bacterium]